MHWSNIRWSEWLEGFQVAVADSPDGPFSFVGPNRTAGTWFTTETGEALPKLYGRYFRYKAFLSSDGFATPAFSNVQISFGGLQPSSVTTYTYDAAGNRVSLVVETDDGVILTETLDDPGWDPEDRINNLNQVMRRDVDDGSSPVSWEYTWDEDGNLTSKSDGVSTWTYSWDEDNRLVRVEGPDSLDVAFSYDSMGRLLRRVSGAEETLFEWDGWDLVRETAPDGTITRYLCPQGELHGFERGGVLYSVHSDALGSVRAITDFRGVVVSHFEYDPWGAILPSSVDGVPGGFAYRFVGAWGVRWDEGVGLHYMRHRWYSMELGRFVLRDPIGPSGGLNLYQYVFASPTNLSDPSGLSCFGDLSDIAWGIGKGLLGALAGVAVGALAFAILPGFAATAFFVVSAASAGFGLGQLMRELYTGKEWNFYDLGKTLNPRELRERAGETLVNLALLRISLTPWMRRGQEQDFGLLAKWNRIRDDIGKVTVSNYQDYAGMAAEERPLRILLKMSPQELRGTWPTGASTGIRFIVPSAVSGATCDR